MQLQPTQTSKMRCHSCSLLTIHDLPVHQKVIWCIDVYCKTHPPILTTVKIFKNKRPATHVNNNVTKRWSLSPSNAKPSPKWYSIKNMIYPYWTISKLKSCFKVWWWPHSYSQFMPVYTQIHARALHSKLNMKKKKKKPSAWITHSKQKRFVMTKNWNVNNSLNIK